MGETLKKLEVNLSNDYSWILFFHKWCDRKELKNCLRSKNENTISVI